MTVVSCARPKSAYRSICWRGFPYNNVVSLCSRIPISEGVLGSLLHSSTLAVEAGMRGAATEVG